MEWALILGLGAAACLFVVRGPWRAFQDSNADFALVYSAARAWLHGLNPYDAADVSAAWLGAGGAEAGLPNPAERGSAVLLYPPSTFVVLAPLAGVPWKPAGALWTILCVALWLVAVHAAGELAGLRLSNAAGKVYWIAALAWAPVHTCIAHGQTAVLATAAAALGLLALSKVCGPRRGVVSGLLLGVGAAVKPQVAGLFTAYAAGRERIIAVLGSIGAALLLLGAGIGRMAVAGIDWWTAWRANVAAFPLVADGNPTATNPIRFQLINLHYPLHTMIDSRDAVRWIVYAIAGGLCLAYYLVDRRLRSGSQGAGADRGDTAAISMVAVVTLLVVYHRAYDATVLVFPLAWAIAALCDAGELPKVRGLAMASLICLVPFLIPGSAILKAIEQRGLVPSGLLASPLWEIVVVPHAVWALLTLALLLIAAQWHRGAAVAGRPV